MLFFFVNQVMMTIKVDIAILQSGSGIEFEIFDKIEEKKFLVLIIKTKQNKKLFTLNKNYQKNYMTNKNSM